MSASIRKVYSFVIVWFNNLFKNNFNHTLRNIWNQKFLIPLIPAMVAFIFSLFIFSHFGVPYDEPISMDRGEINFRFISSLDRSLYDFDGRFHGAWLEVLMYSLGSIFGLENHSREMVLFRRIFQFSLFIIASYFIFLITFHYTINKRASLFAQVALILSPVIFSHAFYNSKDIGFLIFFTIAFYFLLISVEKTKHTFWFTFILALTTGMAIALRQQAVLLVAFALLSYFFHFFIQENKNLSTPKKSWKKLRSHFFTNLIPFLKQTALYIFITFQTVIILTPYLWEHPIYRYLQVFEVMSKYDIWQNNVIYLGQSFFVEDLPWHYIPVWIIASTPIIYLLMAILGMIGLSRKLVYKTIKSKVITKQLVSLLLLFGWLFGPILAIIALDSIVYNSWRHLFFVYPALIIFSGIGFKLTEKKLIDLKLTQLLTVFYTFIISSIIFIFVTMITIHPLQNMYLNPVFNRIANRYSEPFFETDYWGVSSYEALTYIFNKDNRSKITVLGNYEPVYFNELILTSEQKEKIKLTRDINEADYLIVISGKKNTKRFDGFEIIHSKTVQGIPAYYIHKRIVNFEN